MAKVPIVLFALGLSVLVYLFGVASARFEWYPFPVLHDAMSAVRAYRQAYKERATVPKLMQYEDDGTTLPRGDGNGDHGLLLMTGGAYQLPSHCPDFGCVAWVMDRSGRIHHAWPMRRDQPWGDLDTLSGLDYPRQIYPWSAHVYDNGDLLVTYHALGTFPYAVGIARMDRQGNILWKRANSAHHWNYVDDRGLIYTPTLAIVDSPLAIGDTRERLKCDNGKIYKDSVTILDGDGNDVETISMVDLMIEAGYGGLLLGTSEPCDPLHLNYVRPLTEADRVHFPEFNEGDLLVSMRNISTLVVLDRETHGLKWISSGAVIQQHSPHFWRDDRILVFDNKGGAKATGGSRIAAIDVNGVGAETLFPTKRTSPGSDFYSFWAGDIELSPDRRRALISLTWKGRVLELDLQTGEVIWEYVNLFPSDVLENRADLDTEGPFALWQVQDTQYVDGLSFLEN